MNPLGLVIVLVSVAAGVGIVAGSGAGMPAGSGSQETVRICDLKGEITGKVIDINAIVIEDKRVTDIALNLAKANCRDHKPTAWDAWFSVAPDPRLPTAEDAEKAQQFALIGEGYVDIFVKVLDGADDLVADKSFTVRSKSGESSVLFNEKLLFKGLPEDEEFTVKVYTSWGGNKEVYKTTAST